MRKFRNLTVQPNCLKGPVLCGTICMEIHSKKLESIARIGYCIPVQDFYLVQHGLRCRKTTITGLPLVREKSGKFKVREKSGNFRISQGNLEFC